jgi:hypothetical protein
VQHEVHRHRVDDTFLEDDPSDVVASDHPAGVEEQPL